MFPLAVYARTFPAFLEPRRLVGKALAAVVDDLVKAMGMTGISKSQVSRLCAEIDEKVKDARSARDSV